jgi:hypothetical protein
MMNIVCLKEKKKQQTKLKVSTEKQHNIIMLVDKQK